MPAPGRIVFAHGNSFPGGTYRQLFAAWEAAGHDVAAVDRFGHDPRYAVTSNWPQLREQLAQFVAEHGPGPAWLVGHSLGGLLSLMVACRHPGLARGVVMLDSPVISGWRAHSVQVIKATRLIHKVSPARFSARRRQHWPSAAAAREHFAAKAVFARWAPGVLDDYLAAGLRPAAGQVALAFDRDIESRIYNTLPHNLDRVLRRHPPRCPVAFVAGTRSAELRQGGLGAAHALAGPRFAWLEGTHLYPMEKPAETAALVLKLIRQMEAP
jgi:pimeloyl-ACP methyl ester carboxylesterase